MTCAKIIIRTAEQFLYVERADKPKIEEAEKKPKEKKAKKIKEDSHGMRRLYRNRHATFIKTLLD